MYLCACVRVHVLGVCGGGGGETVHLSVRKIGDRGLCTYVHVLGEWVRTPVIQLQARGTVKPSLYPTYHSIITGACQEPAELLERLRLTCAFEIRAERGAPLLLQVKEGGGLGPAPARPGPPRLDASAFQQLRYPVPGRV